MNSSRENHIRFLQQSEIDPQKWDQCLSVSTNGLIYGYSFYLNQVAKNWSGLVLNDYEAVMPLPWNRKYGIRYLYQPAFAAQLGIFSTSPISPALVTAFIDHCKKNFRFCEMPMNPANALPDLPVRMNYILDIQKSYEQIRKDYRKDMIQHLKSTGADTLTYNQTTDYPSVIALYKDLYGKRFPQVTETDYDRFSDLCKDLFQRKLSILREVKDKNSETLLASGIFFMDGKRIYNIMSVTSAEGRQKLANPYLFDQLIQEYSGGNLILDFEGSEIAGIAEFYRKFGSHPEPYPFLRFNRLPFPFRLWK
jgi:hypothetical protein